MLVQVTTEHVHVCSGSTLPYIIYTFNFPLEHPNEICVILWSIVYCLG